MLGEHIVPESEVIRAVVSEDSSCCGAPHRNRPLGSSAPSRTCQTDRWWLRTLRRPIECICETTFDQGRVIARGSLNLPLIPTMIIAITVVIVIILIIMIIIMVII